MCSVLAQKITFLFMRNLAYFFLLALLNKLMSSLSENELAHPRWKATWQKGVPPGFGFDKECSAPVLLKLIKEDSIPIGRALVPGMGRGYDVASLASSSRFVLGIDLSEIGVQEAKQYITTLPIEEKPDQSSYELRSMSFFDLDEAEKFDFIYDYTFLCALSPSVRPTWAKKMSNLVKPGGELLTLIFPIRELETDVPPFKVSLEMYKELLESVGFRCDQLELLSTELSHPGRDGSPQDDPRLSKAFSGIGRWIRKDC